MKTWIQKSLELCEQATPGPWEVTDPDYPGCVTCGADTHIARGGFTNYPSSSLINHHIFGSPSIVKQEDTDFICNARTSLPRALKLLEECKPWLQELLDVCVHEENHSAALELEKLLVKLEAEE